jgi:sirohydrochlorin cobaltochelatase
MELNEPSIPQAVDQLVAEGAQQTTAVPFFLQLGGHVAEDLPEIIGAARAKHPSVTITLAAYLGYDPLLARVIADRVREACEQASCPKRP